MTVQAAAKILAQNPTLQGARQALESIGLRFPKVIEIDPRNPGIIPDYPVVLKVTEPFIAHKTEMGAVKVTGKTSAEEILEFTEACEKKIGETIKKIALEERVSIPEGGETLLALIYDDSFGPVISFGEGGRLTELRKQVVRWLPDESEDKIADILRSLPLYRMWFSEYRSQKPLADLKNWAAFLHRFGAMIDEFHTLRPDLIIRDLEINPVAFTGDEPVALDLLLTIEEKPHTQEIIRPNLKRLSDSFFRAKNIAVAGVSATDPNNIGRVLYDRLLQSFKGNAWAINPKGGEIDGHPIFKSVSELPDAPDILVLALSAHFTAPTLDEAYKKFGDKLGSVLMLASGFDETTGGKEEAEKLKAVIHSVGSVPVIGPNTMAMYAQTGSDGDAKVDFLPKGRVAIPSFDDPSKNNTALILQSGARFASFLDSQPILGFRWSMMVGNAYQTDVADGVAMAAEDPATKVIAIYLEGLQRGAGRRLAEAVRKCRKLGKAVIIQKGGATARGAATARSHTASMSGSHEVFSSILTQAGALLAPSNHDFTDVVKICSVLYDKRPKGPNVFLINGAGYEGVLASDEAARQNLELPKPPETVTEVLQPFLGKILDSTNNPADVGPATPDEAYGPAVDQALQDDRYDAAVLAVMPHGNGMKGILPPFEGDDSLLGPTIVRLYEKYDKPVVISMSGGEKYDGFRKYLTKHNIPIFDSSEQAMKVLGLWYKATKPL